MTECAGACAYDLWKEALDHWSALFNLIMLIAALAALNTWRMQRRAALADDLYVFGLHLINIKSRLCNYFIMMYPEKGDPRYLPRFVDEMKKILKEGSDIPSQTALRIRQARRILKNDELANWIDRYSTDISLFEVHLRSCTTLFRLLGPKAAVDKIQKNMQKMREIADGGYDILSHEEWVKELEAMLAAYQ